MHFPFSPPSSSPSPSPSPSPSNISKLKHTAVSFLCLWKSEELSRDREHVKKQKQERRKGKRKRRAAMGKARMNLLDITAIARELQKYSRIA